MTNGYPLCCRSGWVIARDTGFSSNAQVSWSFMALKGFVRYWEDDVCVCVCEMIAVDGRWLSMSTCFSFNSRCGQRVGDYDGCRKEAGTWNGLILKVSGEAVLEGTCEFEINRKFGIWKLGFGSWDLEFGIWVWSLKIGNWNLQFGTWNLGFQI